MKNRFFAAVLLGALVLGPGHAYAQETGQGQISEQRRQAQTQIQPGDQAQLAKALEPLTVRLARLMIATAYTDPQLTIQELDLMSPDVDRFMAALSGYPDMQKEMKKAFLVLDLVRLNTLAEFGLTSEFEEKIMPLLDQNDDPENRVYCLVVGFRSSLEHGHKEQARRFLQLAQKVATEQPEQIDPVYRYVVATLPAMLRVADGERLSKSERDRLFQAAWAPMQSYSPEVDLSSDDAWYHGRYVTKFWFAQFIPDGDLEHTVLGPAGRQLQAWISHFNPQIKGDGSDPLDQVQQARGAIMYLLSTVDIVLYPYEENPDFIGESEVSDFHAALDQIFTLVDQQADALGGALTLPGYGPFDLKHTGYLESLKIRSKIIYGLDPKQPVEKRRQTLLSLPERIEAINMPNAYITTNMRLGKALVGVGATEEAVAAYKRALKRAEDYHYDLLGAEAATVLAQEYGRRGDLQTAGQYGTRASDALVNGVGTVDRQQLRDETEKLTDQQATAMLDSDAPEQALDVLTRGHQLTVASSQLEGNKQAKGALAELAQKKTALQTLEGNLATLKSMPSSSTRDSLLKRTEGLLADSRAAFLSESRKIRSEFPSLYSSTLRFDPLDMAQIQGTLPADTTVVQYFPTEKKLYFFVVSRNTFRLRTLDIEKAKLDEMALNYVSKVRQLSHLEPQLAKELYDVLIKPVAPDIASSQQLVLIPSGSLNLLPFGALLGEKRLVQEKRLVELAKTTDFLRISAEKPRPISRAVAFANATLDLPGTEKEGEAVKELFPGSKLFEGKQASKANLNAFGSKADVLHLATHGVCYPSDSLKNYLKLSNGEQLAQDEIFGLDLSNTSLVTLSACNTALGSKDDLRSSFVSSLAEAFWIAGSRSVVASLWAVEDQSTQMLMKEFYKGLRGGKSRSQALQDAQEMVLANPTYRHPYYWSGFMLFGDYR